MASDKPIKTSKSQRASVSKRKLAKTAGAIEDVAVAAVIEGEQTTALGVERMKLAGEMDTVGTMAIATGASDITRAVDEKVMSERMAVLSDVVSVAGIADVSQGVEMLAASEDVGVMSALVGMMSVDSLEHGLELARLSGELKTVRELVASLKMPILADFLTARADRLHEMSIEQIRLAISTNGVSQVLATAGERITDLGENEVEEGMTRLTISEAAAVESAAMSKASEELAVQGLEEMIVGGEVKQVARLEAIEGASEISSGSAVVGAALAMDEVASTLKEKSK